MKKNLTKLALSGAALAAVAATLGTSTYAWYTANETVSATNISGASAGAADASIFISKDHSAWSQTVSLAGTYDHDKNTETAEIPWVEGGNLLPVEYVTGDTDTFKDLGTVTNTGSTESPTWTYTPQVTTRSVANGAAKHFTLYFRTSKIADGAPAPTVYLKGITLNNTTTANSGTYTPADNLYYTTANDHGVNVNQATYGVDFTQALKMVVRTNAATAGVASTDTSYVASNVNAKSWDLSKYQQTTLNSNLSTIDASHNAITYYNGIMGTHLAKSMDTTQNQSVIDEKNSGDSARTPISLGTLKRDATYITVDFYIYLDGWDYYCYDACKGQSFDIALDFTSKAEEALTIAA